jgi:hypothetical protein
MFFPSEKLGEMENKGKIFSLYFGIRKKKEEEPIKFSQSHLLTILNVLLFKGLRLALFFAGDLCAKVSS